MGACYLMLGSNLGNRAQNLKRAKTLIKELIGSILKQSSLYESEPWGYNDSKSYYNQAICIQTKIKPIEVLRNCLVIEENLGRVRTKDTYEARPIDIDILFYDMLIISSEDLILPHPRITLRKFVLEPLCEIGSELIHPVSKKAIKKHLEECIDTNWVKKLDI